MILDQLSLSSEFDACVNDLFNLFNVRQQPHLIDCWTKTGNDDDESDQHQSSTESNERASERERTRPRHSVYNHGDVCSHWLIASPRQRSFDWTSKRDSINENSSTSDEDLFTVMDKKKDDRTKQIKEDDEQVRSDNLFELSLSMMTSDFLHSFNENNTLLISNEFFYWKVEEEEKVGFSSSPSEFDWSFVEWSAVADDEPDGHFAKFPRLCSGMAALWNSYRCENTMNRCFVGLQRESGLVMNVGFRRFSTPSRTIEQLHRSLPFPRRSLPTSTSLDFLLLLSFFH